MNWDAENWITLFTFNCVKTCAALLKSHSLSCRHLCQRSDILHCNWSYITADTTFSHTPKENLTFGTIPGSCETSVRRLWASPAVVQWGWGQDWKTELELVQQMLVGSLLLWPSGWKAGHSRCRDCYRRNTGGAIWLLVDGMFDVELLAAAVTNRPKQVKHKNLQFQSLITRNNNLILKETFDNSVLFSASSGKIIRTTWLCETTGNSLNLPSIPCWDCDEDSREGHGGLSGFTINSNWKTDVTQIRP